MISPLHRKHFTYFTYFTTETNPSDGVEELLELEEQGKKIVGELRQLVVRTACRIASFRIDLLTCSRDKRKFLSEDTGIRHAPFPARQFIAHTMS